MGLSSVNWSSFCYEVWEPWLAWQSQSGGPVKIVETGESKFGKSKNNSGWEVEGKWVFGLLERDTKKKWLFPVEKKKPSDFSPCSSAAPLYIQTTGVHRRDCRSWGMSTRQWTTMNSLLLVLVYIPRPSHAAGATQSPGHYAPATRCTCTHNILQGTSLSEHTLRSNITTFSNSLRYSTSIPVESNKVSRTG